MNNESSNEALLASELESQKLEEIEKREKGFYQSCLKQVVQFLNTTLPPIVDSDEIAEKSESEEKEKKERTHRPMGLFKIKDTKKIKRAIIAENSGGPRMRDITPAKQKKIDEKPKEEKKKRINKFSEMKYKDNIKKKQEFNQKKKQSK
ncbi:hypothetical protein ENBRE01_1874 [Enteropsectra breve]|nr:hypothetical protein ENBRE01_1874 [Enteropsectra breve]